MSTPEPSPDRPLVGGNPISPRPGRLLLLATGAGLLAGTLAWLAGEASLAAFRPPTARSVVFGRVVDRATYPDQAAANFKNALLAYAELGALLGLALGLAGGIARASSNAAVAAGASGAALGATLASAAALVALSAYFRAEDQNQEELARDLLLPLLVHAGAWAASGLAAGFALALGLGIDGRGGRARAVRMATAGLIGAALGALVYELVGATVFPEARTAEPVSRTWATRLMARLAVAVLASVIAAAVAESKPRTRVRPDAPAPG